MLEKIGPNTFSFCGHHGNGSVHDFYKGWGQITKSGKYVRWKSWVRPKRCKTTKQSVVEMRERFSQIVFPTIQCVTPDLILPTLLSVQPMTN